ncbi:hypothetical protein RRG08_045772 [Elysia crispata]|uniref:Uncharacterized protein n=1 Tax=Elysia crispata TaxID=231223 RepID=A0AAE1B026_9GAST|nr:hypothetical protein RRG08_045772 [Elysia crispata]
MIITAADESHVRIKRAINVRCRRAKFFDCLDSQVGSCSVVLLHHNGLFILSIPYGMKPTIVAAIDLSKCSLPQVPSHSLCDLDIKDGHIVSTHLVIPSNI